MDEAGKRGTLARIGTSPILFISYSHHPPSFPTQIEHRRRVRKPPHSHGRGAQTRHRCIISSLLFLITLIAPLTSFRAQGYETGRRAQEDKCSACTRHLKAV